MAIIDKSGINITSGFKLISPNPLDVRIVADGEEELQSLIDNKATYDGMIVWVKSLKVHKKYDGEKFITLSSCNIGCEVLAENELGKFVLGEGELA